MTDDERREILEAIARDSDAYPRDRIAAVRALEDMGRADFGNGAFSDLDELAPRRRQTA